MLIWKMVYVNSAKEFHVDSFSRTVNDELRKALK